MRDFVHRWARWRKLPAFDKRALLALLLQLPIVDIALRTAGLKSTQRCLLRLGRSQTAQPPCSSADLARAHRVAELAAVAGAHGIYSITCLRQALVVQCWLRRRGFPAQLRIGATRNSHGTPDTHAWVELDGVALGQPALAHEAFPGLEDPVH